MLSPWWVAELAFGWKYREPSQAHSRLWAIWFLLKGSRASSVNKKHLKGTCACCTLNRKSKVQTQGLLALMSQCSQLPRFTQDWCPKKCVFSAIITHEIDKHLIKKIKLTCITTKKICWKSSGGIKMFPNNYITFGHASWSGQNCTAASQCLLLWICVCVFS